MCTLINCWCDLPFNNLTYSACSWKTTRLFFAQAAHVEIFLCKCVMVCVINEMPGVSIYCAITTQLISKCPAWCSVKKIPDCSTAARGTACGLLLRNFDFAKHCGKRVSCASVKAELRDSTLSEIFTVKIINHVCFKIHSSRWTALLARQRKFKMLENDLVKQGRIFNKNSLRRLAERYAIKFFFDIISEA